MATHDDPPVLEPLTEASIPLYESAGFIAEEPVEHDSDGVAVPIVRMHKPIVSAS